MTITKNLSTIRKNTVLNIIIRKKTSLYHKVQCIYCKKLKYTIIFRKVKNVSSNSYTSISKRQRYFSTGSACIVMGSFNFCHIYFDVRIWFIYSCDTVPAWIYKCNTYGNMVGKKVEKNQKRIRQTNNNNTHSKKRRNIQGQYKTQLIV